MLVLFFDESNEKLFLYLHDKYKKLLYKYAYDILKNHYDAEEALQITWLKVANNIEKIKEQPERKKLNYLITIVKNVSINIYNSKKNIVAIDNDENLTEMMIDKYNDIYFTLELQDFKDAIKSINKEYIMPLMLKYVYGYSIREIADILDISETNVGTRIHRAKLMIKEKLLEGRHIYEQRKNQWRLFWVYA